MIDKNEMTARIGIIPTQATEFIKITTKEQLYEVFGKPKYYKESLIMEPKKPNSPHSSQFQQNYYEPSPKQYGFPSSDDGLALQQLADGDYNLDSLYNHQFVQNEVIHNTGEVDVCSYQFEFTPILPGTVTGTAYQGETAICTFVIGANGAMTTTPIGDNGPIKPILHSFNKDTGELKFKWTIILDGSIENLALGTHKLVVSYEYNIESQQQAPQKSKSIWDKLDKGEIAESETVCSHAEVMKLREELAAAKEELNNTKRMLSNIEVDLFEEYEVKVNDVKNYLVGQVDGFLQKQVAELENVKRLKEMGGAKIVEETISNDTKWEDRIKEAKELRRKLEEKKNV